MNYPHFTNSKTGTRKQELGLMSPRDPKSIVLITIGPNSPPSSSTWGDGVSFYLMLENHSDK